MTDRPHDGASFRRDIAATALVVSALLGLLSVALQPDFPADHARRLAALDAAGAGAAVSAVAFLLQQLPFAVAVLGLGHLLRQRAPRLSTTGVVLGVLGAFGHTVFGGLSMAYLLMAGDPSRRTAYAALYERIESSPVMLFAIAGLAGTVLGLLLLTIALFRTALVPRWVPSLLVAFLVLEFAGSAVSAYASEVAGACALIAFTALALRIHRMPVAAWRAVTRPGSRLPSPRPPDAHSSRSPRVSARIPSCRSNRSAGSLKVSGPYWPKSSKLTHPNIAAQARTPRTTRSSGMSAPVSARTTAKSAASRLRDGWRRGGGRERPGLVGGVVDPDESADHPRAGTGRPLGGRVVAGHRAAEQQRIGRRFGQGPRPHGPADRDEPAPVGDAVHLRQGSVDGVAQLVVPVDHEQGEQVVAAAHVAVDGRGDHAEVACHGPHGQRRCAVGGEVLAADAGDVLERLGPRTGPGVSAGMARSCQKQERRTHM